MGDGRDWECERCGHALLRGNWCGQVRPGNRRPDAVAAILHAVAVNPCCDGECKLPAGAEPIVWQLGMLPLERPDCAPGRLVRVSAATPWPFVPRRVAVLAHCAPHFDLVLPAQLWALPSALAWKPLDTGEGFTLEVRNNTMTTQHFGGSARGYFRQPDGPRAGEPPLPEPVEIR